MREKRTVQSSIFHFFADHEIGRELQAISNWLDSHPEILELVAADIQEVKVNDCGRKGLPVESVLRCAILKQYRQVSYEELAFYLLDSHSFQAFARLPLEIIPRKAVLQRTISRISDVTWEKINQALLRHAKAAGVERGQVIRLDSTATDSNIHEPSDSSLLWDGVRVLTQLFEQARELSGGGSLPCRNHCRRAKRRMCSIRHTRGRDKKAALYQDLIQVTRMRLSYIDPVYQILAGLLVDPASCAVWLTEVEHYRGLIERVIEQTERRVFHGEKVPAREKIFSLFEEHTDIIVKGSRDIQYGHKLNLMTGQSGLVLDVMIEAGNPADTERFLPMLDRHIQHYGKAPRQMAVDGGYASKDNLKEAKAKGVKDMAFHKKKGLKVKEMAKSDWVYRKLRNFRAGIEAGISHLKRCFGLRRCNWKGLEHFKAYVWSAVVTHNLVTLARLKPA
ncbi:ISNCY family transposase [Thiolapillus sp.]|uniref:ISNCY family transposase n=4 Tax=Thiolapillus sp. TaxID=2017437 RepID=UPI003AF90959